MASKDNSEGPFTDGAYSYPMEGLRSLVRIVSPETLWDRRYSPAVLEDGQGCTESASMGQSPSVAGFVQQAHQVVQQKPVETAPLKRRKKEPGAPTKKSVVVLKGSDVTTRDGLVFMPNAIEMANLKKTGKGQFKKMEMSSKMSETEIGQTLTALFPNLENKRFYCASAADNRTRLDFHGEPRIWNGRFMKQTIKGNSALYVFVDEPQVTSVEETPMEVDQNQEESATSGQQSVGNPSLQVPDGNVQARDTSCPPLPHSCQHARGMVSSTLAPHMSSLNISGAPFMQENRGESGSDYESQSTDSATDRPTDSGIEASDVFCVSDGPTETLPEPVLRGSSVLDMLPNDPCSGAVSEGQQDLPSGVPPPPSSQMTDSGVPNAAIEENSFDGESDDLTALLGVVQGIYPLSGSLEGGVPFQVTVKEELPDEVNQGTAEFQGVATVPIFKENPFIFQGIVPRSEMPGIVPVIIKTDAEKRLGITSFEYIDEMRNMVRQLVHNPKLQGILFAMWSEELGFLPTGGNATHALKQLKEVSDEDSSDQTEDRISVKLLQQMVYTAAQSGGQQFIEIVFGTSAGQLVFNSYKDKKPLPEDVARANGHEELAEYFKDIKTSLSQDEDVQSNAIDWSELMMAIQKKTAVKRIESTIGLEQSSQDDDDNLSDYFADAESCSCESSDCDTDGSDIVEKSDSKECWVIERELTQEQIAIENVPAVNKSVALNKGEERESCKVQTPQRLGNSTGLHGVSTVEGTGKEIYLGQIMVQLADFWTSTQEANITRVVTFFFKAQKGSLRKQDSSCRSKQSALKRSHDQMTSTMKNGFRIDKDDMTIMAQGEILAQLGMTQNIVSTASESQTREPSMHISDGHAETRNTIPSESSLLPHADLQGIVSSSLTPQLNSLCIASAACEQERCQLLQTTADLAHIILEARTRQEQGNGTATRAQGITCNSTDQSKRCSVVYLGVQCAGKRGSVSNAADAHQEDYGSGFESPSSESAVERPSDLGIEGSDNFFVDDENLENTVCLGILEPDDKKDLPSDGGPSTASMGGFEFRISLKEALPDEVKSGHAWFDKVAIVPVHKLNPFTLYGTVPRSQVTGDVVVGVRIDCFQELGITLFKYIDDGENTLKQFIQDPALQARYFTMMAGNLANGIPTSGSHLTQALGPMNVLQNGSSIQVKQQQSVELLQLMVYTAAQTGAQRFIEMVFSASAGQVVFNSYKDRNSLPEDVARATGHDELAQYLQDVHTRLSLDKNVHSTVIDWLELVEAVQKQSLTTQDESPVGLDQSDEDDDDSSDYFADAETSSCGSCDDDPGWPEMSEKKEPCLHDEISSEVQASSENNDLSTTCSTKASFTKNEGITKGESTKGQTARDDICFVVKQGSSCLDKGRETEEYSELSSSLSCVADLLEMSCDDLNKENSISKGPCIHGEISSEVQSIGECNDLSRTCSSEASFTKNERIRTGESTKRQITRDEISFVVKQGSSCLDKGKEREIAELSKPQRITSLPELFAMSCEDPGEGNLITKTSRNNMAKQPREPCMHDVTFSEVLPVEIIVSWCDDLSMTSSKASFTKKEKIVEVESTKRQTTSEDRAFAMKQGSFCLEKGKEREFSELSRPQKISFLPKLLGMSCEDLNSGDIISTESSTGDGIYVETYIKSAVVSDHSPMNKFAMRTSDSNNDRILTGEELNQQPTAKPDGIAMNSKAHINKEEEDASVVEEGVISDTEEFSTRDGNCVETYIKSAAVSDHSPMNKFAMKASDSNNGRILTGEELNQEPTAKPDGISMNSEAHINKEEEDASAAEEGVISDTEGSPKCGSTNFPPMRCRWEKHRLERKREIEEQRKVLQERKREIEEHCKVLQERKREIEEHCKVLQLRIFLLEINIRYLQDLERKREIEEQRKVLQFEVCQWWLDEQRRVKIFEVCQWWLDEQRRVKIPHVLKRKLTKCFYGSQIGGLNLIYIRNSEIIIVRDKTEDETEQQLFALKRLLAQKLSTKTMINVHLVRRKRRLQSSYEACNDPVSRSLRRL